MMSINLAEALASLQDYWSPKIVGRVNDQYVKVAKLKGELAWHKHDEEDELFQVVIGKLVIQLEGGSEVRLGPGCGCLLTPALALPRIANAPGASWVTENLVCRRTWAVDFWVFDSA